MGGIVYGRERKREREDGGEGGKEEGRERILTGREGFGMGKKVLEQT